MPSSSSNITYTLYTSPGSFRAFAILIAAEYAKLKVTVDTTTTTTMNISELSPTHKLPVLVVENNDNTITPLVLSGSHSIARYVAPKELLLPLLPGNNNTTDTEAAAAARIDMWIEFCSNQVELPACVWFYPAAGYMPFHKEAYHKAKKDLAVALSILETQLSQSHRFIVGNSVTLADIVLCCTLFYPLTLVCDAHSYLKDFSHVVEWFRTCVRLPEFQKVLGNNVELCQQETLAPTTTTIAGGAGGVQNQQQEQHQNDDDDEKKKIADAASPKVRVPVAAPPTNNEKTEHIYRIMDREQPSPFQLDAWKKTYSNKNANMSTTIMNDYFWKTFDTQGWSLWHQDYNHNDENKRTFMCSNKITGFQQRTDSIRRWAFGVMVVLGDEGDLEISGVWLLRGDSVEAMLEANDDANWYTWTKLAGKDMEPTDEVKAKVAAYWCDENEIEGKPVQDSKVFK